MSLMYWKKLDRYRDSYTSVIFTVGVDFKVGNISECRRQCNSECLAAKNGHNIRRIADMK